MKIPLGCKCLWFQWMQLFVTVVLLVSGLGQMEAKLAENESLFPTSV